MAALSIGCVCLVWFGLGLAAGRHQQREGGGSRGHLVRAAAFAAGVSSLPLLAFAMLLAVGELPWELPWDLPGELLVCLALGGWSCLSALSRPVALTGTKESLALVTDPPVVERVAGLARALGIRAPRLRLIHTGGGGLSALACAGGLPAPSLVVGEAVFTGLSVQERDAILAHELAHIANGSLWALAAVGPIAMALGVLALPMIGEGLVPLFGLTIWVGLRSVVQRPFEVACDLSAARQVGFAVTSNALDRVHAAVPFSEQGWLGLMIYSTTSHPAISVRRRALWRAAPPAEREGIVDAGTGWSRFRAGALVALLAWLGVSTGVLFGAGTGAVGAGPATTAMLAVALAPTALMLTASWRLRRRAARRLRGGMPRGRVMQKLAVLLLAFVMVLVIFATVSPYSTPSLVLVLGAALLIGFLVCAFLGVRDERAWVAARRVVGTAIARGDFAKAYEEGRQYRALLRRDRGLAHDVALSAAISGHRLEALMLFDLQLTGERPMPQSLLTCSRLLLASDPDRSERLAARAASMLPGDPAPLAYQAQALRKLGRSAEATASADAGVSADATDCESLAIRALLHEDAGESAAADSCLAAAEAHSLGNAYVAVARAELLLARKDPAAPAAVRRAVEITTGDPLSLLRDRALELSGPLISEASITPNP